MIFTYAEKAHLTYGDGNCGVASIFATKKNQFLYLQLPHVKKIRLFTPISNAIIE